MKCGADLDHKDILCYNLVCILPFKMTKFVNWSKDFKHGVARQEEKGNTSRHRVRWRQMIRFGDLYREKSKEAENKALVLAEDVLSESPCSSQKFYK